MANKCKFPHADEAAQYALDVVTGRVIACKWVRLAAARHLDDLEQQDDPCFPYYFDAAGTDSFCAFVELMPHIKGKWEGSCIVMEPWQKFTFGIPFGWKKKSNGKRRYRELYIEIPRKNGKSPMGACIGNYMLTADGEPGAEVYSGASTERQAWEVFGPARLMSKKRQDYQRAFNLDVSAKSITIQDTASKFLPIVGKPGDGSSPHCALVDEFHEHDGPELYDTMKTGMAAREQPMLVVITTAGMNSSGPCYDQHCEVIKMLEGSVDKPGLWGVIYTLDKGDDWADLSLWPKANPNYNISVFEDFLIEQHREALQRTDRQNIIKCKHLNLWSNAAIGWINMHKWNSCADKSLKIDDFWGCRCFTGIDLASKVDLVAMMFLFEVLPSHAFARFTGKEYVLFGKYYLPEETIELPENSDYRKWRDLGLITQTPGARTDFAYIEDDLKRMLGRHDLLVVNGPEETPEQVLVFNIVELGYDQREAEYLMQNIREWAPFECVEVPQSPAHMSEPMKEFEALYMSGRLRHDDNPVLNWQAGNVIQRRSRNKSYYPAKERAKDKIDGIVASVTALSRAMTMQEENLYETQRGFKWL